jgi:hypothetical protein
MKTASREVDELLLHLKGLVLVRAILEQRGASQTELDEHSAEIGRLRGRLAQLVRDGHDGYHAAA